MLEYDRLNAKNSSSLVGDVAQLLECLPTIHGVLGFIPNIR